MDDHQRPNGIPVTRFTLQSIYAQRDDEKLEFEYESGNTNILVCLTCILVNYYLHVSCKFKMHSFCFSWYIELSMFLTVLRRTSRISRVIFYLEEICGFNALRFQNEANGMPNDPNIFHKVHYVFYLHIKKMF